MERWVVSRLRGAIWEAEIAMKQANTARRMEGEWAGLGVEVRMAARVRVCNYVKTQRQSEFTTSTEDSNMHCARCVEITHFVNVAKHIHDWCSIF